MLRQRHTLFPVLLAGLTLALVLFMAWAFTRSAPEPVPEELEAPAVTEKDYRDEAREALDGFLDEYDGQPDDLSRLLVTERRLDAMLDIRVPVEYLQFHQEVVFGINLMKQGLRGDRADIERGRARFQSALDTQPWID